MTWLIFYVFIAYAFMLGFHRKTYPLSSVILAPLYMPFAIGAYMSAQLDK